MMEGKKKRTGNLTPLHALYTDGEEVFNAVSHGIGALLSIAGLVILVVCSVIPFNPLKFASSIVFGVSLILLFSASMLYHADAYPNLRGMYDENDGNTQVFYMKNATATISSFTNKPVVIEF